MSTGGSLHFGFIPQSVVVRFQSSDYEQRVAASTELLTLIENSDISKVDIQSLLLFVESYACDQNYLIAQNVSRLISCVINKITSSGLNCAPHIHQVVHIVLVMFEDRRRTVCQLGQTVLMDLLSTNDHYTVISEVVRSSSTPSAKVSVEVFRCFTNFITQGILQPNTLLQFPFYFDTMLLSPLKNVKQAVLWCVEYIKNNFPEEYTTLTSLMSREASAVIGNVVGNPNTAMPKSRIDQFVVNRVLNTAGKVDEAKAKAAMTRTMPLAKNQYARPSLPSGKSARPIHLLASMSRPVSSKSLAPNTFHSSDDNPNFVSLEDRLGQDKLAAMLQDRQGFDETLEAASYSNFEATHQASSAPTRAMAFTPYSTPKPVTKYNFKLTSPTTFPDQSFSVANNEIEYDNANERNEHSDNDTTKNYSGANTSINTEVETKPKAQHLTSGSKLSYKFNATSLTNNTSSLSINLDSSPNSNKKLFTDQIPKPKKNPPLPIKKLITLDSNVLSKGDEPLESPSNAQRQKRAKSEARHISFAQTTPNPIPPTLNYQEEADPGIENDRPIKASGFYNIGDDVDFSYVQASSPNTSMVKKKPQFAMTTKRPPKNINKSPTKAKPPQLEVNSKPKVQTVVSLIEKLHSEEWNDQNNAVLELTSVAEQTSGKQIDQICENIRDIVTSLLECAASLRSMLAKNSLNCLMKFIKNDSIDLEPVSDMCAGSLLQLLSVHKSKHFIFDLSGECFSALIDNISIYKAVDILKNEHKRKHDDARAQVALCMSTLVTKLADPSPLLKPLVSLVQDRNPDARKYAKQALSTIRAKVDNFDRLLSANHLSNEEKLTLQGI